MPVCNKLFILNFKKFEIIITNWAKLWTIFAQKVFQVTALQKFEHYVFGHLLKGHAIESNNVVVFELAQKFCLRLEIAHNFRARLDGQRFDCHFDLFRAVQIIVALVDLAKGTMSNYAKKYSLLINIKINFKSPETRTVPIAMHYVGYA